MDGEDRVLLNAGRKHYEPAAPRRSAPARGPPLWAAADAEHEPATDPLLQCAPAFAFDQRLTW